MALGWSFGIEWDPEASHGTDLKHRGMPAYRGRYIRAKRGASPMENWIALKPRRDRHPGGETRVERPADVHELGHHRSAAPPGGAALPGGPRVRRRDAPRGHAAWPAGYFASFHAYPYYPDFLRWQRDYQTYHRPRDGKVDPYAGYIHDLRLHHAGIPLMVTEFGQPTSLGCAHLAPLGRNQGCHSEQEAATNVVDMLHDLRDEGLAGGVVFMWLDEWFKFTWNTIDYELPHHNRALWRNVFTNEEHSGSSRRSRGPGTSSSSTGTTTSGPPSRRSAHGNRSIGDVAATSDAENVYLRLKVSPDLWRHKRIVIGLDARPGGNRGLPGLPGVDPGAEMAVVIEPGGEARMYHAGWIETLGLRYGINKGYIPTNRADVLPGSGTWVRLRQILNYPYRLPESGRMNPTELRDASLMPWGTTDPASPAFDDRNLVDGPRRGARDRAAVGHVERCRSVVPPPVRGRPRRQGHDPQVDRSGSPSRWTASRLVRTHGDTAGTAGTPCSGTSVGKPAGRSCSGRSRATSVPSAGTLPLTG